MLNIFYGDMKEAVYNTAGYFKYDYEDDWIVSLLKEAKQWPLALKERITISAAHNPLARLVLISEKVLKSYVRRLIR